MTGVKDARIHTLSLPPAFPREGLFDMPIAVSQFAIKYIIDSEDVVLANAAETNFAEVENVQAQIAAGRSSALVAMVLTREEAEARFDALSRAAAELQATVLSAVRQEVEQRVEARVRELIPVIRAELAKSRD